jgi:hypothetical protein
MALTVSGRRRCLALREVSDRAERLIDIELGDGASGFAARNRFRAACAPS